MSAKKTKLQSRGLPAKIWVATIELAYEVVGTGTTERAAIDAACELAAKWLRSAKAEAHPEGPWTAKRVEGWHGVRTYHVPVGGAVQS